MLCLKISFRKTEQAINFISSHLRVINAWVPHSIWMSRLYIWCNFAIHTEQCTYYLHLRSNTFCTLQLSFWTIKMYFTVEHYRYKFTNDIWIIYFSICSSSVGATSDCVFLAPPGQQGHRDGSVSPNTAKRDRSISVIAGKSIKNTLMFSI